MNTSTFNNSIRVAGILALLTVFTIGLNGCKKEDPVEEEPEIPETPAVQENPTPTIESGAGSLVAVKSSTTQEVPGFGTVEIPMNIAVAVFFDGTDYSSFLNAGTVSCETEELSINANNSYTFTPGTTNAEGIDFQGQIDWDVTGNGSVGAFNHTVGIGFPTVGDINSGTTVSLSNGYTLSVPSITGADSVIFMVGGVLFTEPGSTTSHTFSSSDLSGLTAGTSVAQVAAYKTEQATVGGGDYWFVNETVETLSVTLE